MTTSTTLRFTRRPLHRNALGVALMLGTLLPVATARAEMAIGVAIEYFDWKEDTTPIVVRETGPVVAASLSYLQDQDSGMLLGYRGKVWGGRVNYDGSLLNQSATPLSSKTGYAGISNELQLRWRRVGERARLDAVFGLGLDNWRRSLSSSQKEDFHIGYLRLGMESGADDAGKWSAAMGVKYPVWTRENAYLNELGFDADPPLEPGPQISVYADLGYRVSADARVLLYYDGFRFQKSDTAQAFDAQGGSPFQPASTLSATGIRVEILIR